MTFTRQDVYTFAVGLGVALLLQLGSVLVRLDSEQITDWGAWALSLATGLLAATGRYLLTEFSQRAGGEG